jgi:hypothetical protein
MAPNALRREYPVAYFLHSSHAAARTVQAILQMPHLLKPSKAWLPGYLPAANSMVTSACGIGEWQEEDEVRGFVYYILNEKQERKLKEHVGSGCEVKKVDFEVCAGGIFGRRDWVRGRAFVTIEEEEGGEIQEQRLGGPERLEGIQEEAAYELARGCETAATPPGLHTPTQTPSRKQKRKAFFRRVTDPLGFRSPSVQPDEQSGPPTVEAEGARRRSFSLIRRITMPNPLPSTYESEVDESSGTVGLSGESKHYQDVEAQQERPPRSTSPPQLTDPNSPRSEHEYDEEVVEVEESVEEAREIEELGEAETLAKIEEIKGEAAQEIGTKTEGPNNVRGIVAMYEELNMQGEAV